MSFVPVAAALLLAGGPAASGDVEQPAPSWGFEIKSGPYQPQIGPGQLHQYYLDIYASQPHDALFEHHPLMWTLEFDWYLLRTVGLLGPFAHVGYWSVSGPMRVCGAVDTPTSCTSGQVLSGESRPGNDTTTLTAYPVGLGLVYRFDLLKRYTPIPLVPFVKGSIDHFFWRNTAAGKLSQGKDTNGNKIPSEGGTWGAEASVGLAFNLDILEPDVAARSRATTGMTDTYLFAEGTRIWANGFGSTGRLDFSGTLLQVGLAIDFE
jgi:hypothetical protein